MTQILYYLFIKPLSLLPFWVLYGLSNVFAFILKYIIPYRKEVIMNNLRNSFPEKPEEELVKIKNQFLEFFSDLIVESIKMFSVSAEDAKRRMKVVNPEVIDQFHDQGKHIIVATGHYNNWEMAASGIPFRSKHVYNGIYSPLKNKFINKKIIESRSKYGAVLTSKKDFKKWIQNVHEEKELQAIALLADQSGTYSKNVYWMNFLNQETAVMFGSEKYAKDLNLPFLTGKIERIKRGHFQVVFELITDNPRETPHGFITEAHTRALESWIREKPQYWLWTHRRWKRKRKPEELLAN